MKKASFSIVCLAILTPALLFSQTQGRGNDENKAKDEALIRKLLSQSEERWNKHDAEALAALSERHRPHQHQRRLEQGAGGDPQALGAAVRDPVQRRHYQGDAREDPFPQAGCRRGDRPNLSQRPAEATESLATFVMTKDGDKWQVVSYQATRIQNAPKEK